MSEIKNKTYIKYIKYIKIHNKLGLSWAKLSTAGVELG